MSDSNQTSASSNSESGPSKPSTSPSDSTQLPAPTLAPSNQQTPDRATVLKEARDYLNAVLEAPRADDDLEEALREKFADRCIAEPDSDYREFYWSYMEHDDVYEGLLDGRWRSLTEPQRLIRLMAIKVAEELRKEERKKGKAGEDGKHGDQTQSPDGAHS